MELFDALVGSFSLCVILVVSISILLYKYLTRNDDYWKVRGVPYKKPIVFIGSNWDILRMNIHDASLKRYQDYGAVYGTFEGPKPTITVGDPELLRDILLKDFQYFPGHRPFSTNDKIMDRMLQVLMGDDWKRVRSLVSQMFSTGKLKRVFAILKDCSMTVVQNFKDAAKKDKPIDAKKLYGAFTIDIIANSAFSMKIDSHNDPENDFARRANSIFSTGLRWRFLLTFMFPRLMKLLGVTMLPKEEVDFFQKVVLEVITERRKSGEVRNDFLQLLMDATKDSEESDKVEVSQKEANDLLSNYGDDSTSFQLFKPFSNKRLNMDELVAQCVNFFIVGYDTTASTLSFATYLLALNEDVQEKLRQEVDKSLEESGGEINYEIVQNMKYLDNVISETLRLYPPVVGIERRADADYKLGNTGIVIPKDMIIMIPIYAMHRDPKYFPNPEKFNPDRFTLEERLKRPQHCYIPFAAGPRNCVAMRFALMEIKICLALVVANLYIKRCEHTKVPIEFHPGMGMLQPKDIILEMKIRDKN